MSNYYKGAKIKSLETTDAEMAMINKQALVELKKEDIFTFKIAMTNNLIDRDYERIGIKGLNQLKEMFIGKTVIVDHDHKAGNQIGRIYNTELIASDEVDKQTNEPITKLVAHCYMLKNCDLVNQIESGIMKEVSIGFQVGSAICSICGKDLTKDHCNHWAGETYDDKLCYFTFDDITDAYEVSFVAVPANAKASVVKSLRKEVTEVEDEKKPTEETPIKPEDEEVVVEVEPEDSPEETTEETPETPEENTEEETTEETEPEEETDPEEEKPEKADEEDEACKELDKSVSKRLKMFETKYM